MSNRQAFLSCFYVFFIHFVYNLCCHALLYLLKSAHYETPSSTKKLLLPVRQKRNRPRSENPTSRRKHRNRNPAARILPRLRQKLHLFRPQHQHKHSLAHSRGQLPTMRHKSSSRAIQDRAPQNVVENLRMPLHDTNSRRHHHRHRALLLLAIFRQRARILAAPFQDTDPTELDNWTIETFLKHHHRSTGL